MGKKPAIEKKPIKAVSVELPSGWGSSDHLGLEKASRLLYDMSGGQGDLRSRMAKARGLLSAELGYDVWEFDASLDQEKAEKATKDDEALRLEKRRLGAEQAQRRTDGEKAALKAAEANRESQRLADQEAAVATEETG